MSEIPLEIQVGELLRAHHVTLVTAESCTGGLIGHLLTNIPGSSEYYLGGVVAYAYEAKVALLGVSWATLHQFGAVSEEVALEMARGARAALHGDIAVSVTGIAGPGGGLPNKPVGLTWIGISTPAGAWAQRFLWQGDREGNKLSSARAALEMVLSHLKTKVL
ncbi:MAG: CinA family protein [Anaerolineales bacterium]|nr:CinA family protein [Anaerolineales bacterium]